MVLEHASLLARLEVLRAAILDSELLRRLDHGREQTSAALFVRRVERKLLRLLDCRDRSRVERRCLLVVSAVHGIGCSGCVASVKRGVVRAHDDLVGLDGDLGDLLAVDAFGFDLGDGVRSGDHVTEPADEVDASSSAASRTILRFQHAALRDAGGTAAVGICSRFGKICRHEHALTLRVSSRRLTVLGRHCATA